MITKEELLEEYNRLTDSILDECDWKTHFTGEEACGMVHHILSRGNIQLNITPNSVHELYSQKVSSLNLTAEEWRNNYGVSEITSMIYDIISLNGEDSQVL